MDITAEQIYNYAVRVATELAVRPIIKSITYEELHAILRSHTMSTPPNPVQEIGRKFQNQDLIIDYYTAYPQGSIIISCAKSLQPDGFRDPIGSGVVFYMTEGAPERAFCAPGRWIGTLIDLSTRTPEIKKEQQQELLKAKYAEIRQHAQQRAQRNKAERISDWLKPLGEWHCDRKLLIYRSAPEKVLACWRTKVGGPLTINMHHVTTVLDTTQAQYGTVTCVEGEWLEHAERVLQCKQRGEFYEHFSRESRQYRSMWRDWA